MSKVSLSKGTAFKVSLLISATSSSPWL